MCGEFTLSLLRAQPLWCLDTRTVRLLSNYTPFQGIPVEPARALALAPGRLGSLRKCRVRVRYDDPGPVVRADEVHISRISVTFFGISVLGNFLPSCAWKTPGKIFEPGKGATRSPLHALASEFVTAIEERACICLSREGTG